MHRHIPAWRVFKRMQWTSVVVGGLLYAAVSLHGWSVLELPEAQKRLAILYGPAVFFAVCLGAPLLLPLLRRPLKRYVWLSFAAGFGQTVASLVVGLGLLVVAAFFIWLQIQGAQTGGRPPGGIFSAYGAGLGVLLAQALLVLALEREPLIREIIERPE